MSDLSALTAHGPRAIFDEDLIAEVAAQLDLRRPNELAVETIARRLADFDAQAGDEFVGVVDVATGVGKTYILAGAIEYFARLGVRNFAVVTPGRTILDKTKENFTRGGRKSLAGYLTTEPVVITSENFATPAMKAAMDDPDRVKLYVFTVQALIRPTSRVSRRTHAFQEGLGEAFYGHLAGLDDLMVFADEHHTYFGRAFSRAIGDLHPYALVGLTATPHPNTPVDQIIFRYPLANAIADQLVKTPVLVGRRDDRADDETKLRDAVALLDAKTTATSRWTQAQTVRTVNPVMLVVCENIDHAKDVEAMVASQAFAGGRFADAVLRIDSEVPDAALAALETVEDPDSPVRIIVSVGMLKEGWDVANVYVICSLRPSISQILTEQTLGRGLRLPYGEYTGVELLDTLEVVAHERYEQLLRRVGSLREDVIDWRTVPDPTQPQVEDSVPPKRDPVQSPLVAAVKGGKGEGLGAPLELVEPPSSGDGQVPPGGLRLVDRDSRVDHVETAAPEVANLPPSSEWELRIPRLAVQRAPVDFSLADITDPDRFRMLGRALRLNPEDVLRRSLLSARTQLGPDGVRRIELETRPASDEIYSQGVLITPEEARRSLLERIVLAPQVPVRASERRAAEPLIEAFLDGVGDWVNNLGAYLDRAAGALIGLVGEEARRYARRPRQTEVTKVERFTNVRTGRRPTSTDRLGEFRRGVGYRGWHKSLYEENWFDSRPERTVANAADDHSEVLYWVRLLRGDLPILWNGMDNWYHPDLIVVETEGTHWLVEVKSDSHLHAPDVQEKRNAAERWAARVSADIEVQWRYLLLSETHIEQARGSWTAMKAQHSGR